MTGLLYFWFIPLIGIFFADAILTALYLSGVTDATLDFELTSQFFLNAISFCSAVFVFWTLANIVRNVINIHSRTIERLIYVIGLLLGSILFDRAIFGHTISGHWSLPIIRVGTCAAVAGLLSLYTLKDTLYRRSLRPIRYGIVVLSLGVVFVCLAFGTSLIPPTPKYLKESIDALVLCQLELLWVLFSLVSQSKDTRFLIRATLIGIAVFIITPVATLSLSGNSTYALVTYLEGTRSLRNFNRNLYQMTFPRGPTWIDSFVGVYFPLENSQLKYRKDLKCHQIDKPLVSSVLIVTIDALRADYFGVPISELSNISKLQNESVVFTNVIQPTSGTIGSLAGIHTGRYLSAVSPTKDIWPILARDLSLSSGSTIQNWATNLESYTNQTIEEIRRRKTNRFLIHSHYLHLHMPNGMRRITHDYQRVLKSIDVEIGRIIDFVQSENLANETMIVLSADHGEELTEERGYVSHGYGVTQTLIHTPLMIRIPGVSPSTITQIVSGIDLLPTVLEAFGAECNYKIHGYSLLNQRIFNRTVYASSVARHRALDVNPTVISDIHAVISFPWKLVVNRKENAFALFNVATDPKEKVNLVDREPQKVSDLMPLLFLYLKGNIKEHLATGRYLYE